VEKIAEEPKGPPPPPPLQERPPAPAEVTSNVTIIHLNQEGAAEQRGAEQQSDRAEQALRLEQQQQAVKPEQQQQQQQQAVKQGEQVSCHRAVTATVSDQPAQTVSRQANEQQKQGEQGGQSKGASLFGPLQKSDGGGLFPLLPKPPSRETKNRVPKPSYNNILQPTLVPPTVKPISHQPMQDQAMAPFEKSKSLPRGHIQSWPDDDELETSTAETTHDIGDDPAEVERLQMELLRLQFENEELESLKSELQWRKKSERKEIKQLGEEMATMQTLYQYRTYSVDSSESSSDEHSNDIEEVEELRRKLAGLIRDNKELEDKRLALCDKIQQERSACVQLRVEIKLEQERIRKRNG